MTTTTTTTTTFPEITKLLGFVENEYIANGNVPYVECLKQVIKRNHYWPQLQMKPFFAHPGLVLLHNTYKRKDVTHFQALYDECRSVVLDLNAPQGQNVVVSLANTIPKQMSIDEYTAAALPDDKCESSFEGTMVNVYNARGVWHFSTTSCPTINSSRYAHPTKSHGAMFDEALAKIIPDIPPGVDEMDADIGDGCGYRDRFTSTLDPTLAYTFVLVHHENNRLVDHTDELGQDYTKLVHIGTRDLRSFQSVDVVLPGVIYATMFPSPIAALEWLTARAANNVPVFGIIVKRASGELIKVQPDVVVKKDQQDMGHSNPWHNMLWVYMQNNPEFKVDHYIAKYHPHIFTNQIAPTYVIHTAVCTMQDILFGLYRATTFYSVSTGRYTMNKPADEGLPPILRFHLAQLRFTQITSHTHAPINRRAIYKYLCDNNSIKNFRLLLHFFATCPADMTPQAHNCIVYLDNMLSRPFRPATVYAPVVPM